MARPLFGIGTRRLARELLGELAFSRGDGLVGLAKSAGFLIVFIFVVVIELGRLGGFVFVVERGPSARGRGG